MCPVPLKNLSQCAVSDCEKHSDVIVQRKVGDKLLTYAYCAFHGVIASAVFHAPNRKEIRF